MANDKEKPFEETQMTPKHKAMIDKMLARINALYALDPSSAMGIVGTTSDTAKRIMGRLSVQDDAERVEFVQSDGPTIEFTGRMLAEHVTEKNEVELWLTLSGKWVLMNEYHGKARSYVFEVEDCIPGIVFKATGYANWVKPIAKKMGWQWRQDID